LESLLRTFLPEHTLLELVQVKLGGNVLGAAVIWCYDKGAHNLGALSQPFRLQLLMYGAEGIYSISLHRVSTKATQQEKLVSEMPKALLACATLSKARATLETTPETAIRFNS
jgi:hypothetical protein